MNNSITGSQIGVVKPVGDDTYWVTGIYLVSGSAGIKDSEIFSDYIGIQSINSNLILENSLVSVSQIRERFNALGLYLHSTSANIQSNTTIRAENPRDFGAAVAIWARNGSTVQANNMNVTHVSSIYLIEFLRKIKWLKILD